VDDQPRARQSLKTLLATWRQAKEVREAANGQQAVQLVEEAQPDIVLMDARMPEMDGLQATRLIKAKWPQVKVILLSMYTDYQDDALAAGADAFIGKGELAGQLLTTLVEVVERGQKNGSN
jgi:YesN/AraC family two-component response regulator